MNQYPAYQTIAAAGCGLDLKCICTDDAFWRTLQGVFAKKACTPLEAQSTSTETACSLSVPHAFNLHLCEYQARGMPRADKELTITRCHGSYSEYLYYSSAIPRRKSRLYEHRPYNNADHRGGRRCHPTLSCTEPYHRSMRYGRLDNLIRFGETQHR